MHGYDFGDFIAGCSVVIRERGMRSERKQKDYEKVGVIMTLVTCFKLVAYCVIHLAFRNNRGCKVRCPGKVAGGDHVHRAFVSWQYHLREQINTCKKITIIF